MLLVARIARADDTDNSVSFDDLAELTSALNRRSDFHVLSPFFHKIAKHAAVPPSPNPDTLASTVLHRLVASCLPRRSLRFITRSSGDAVRWNGIHRKTFRNPCLSYKILPIQLFVKSYFVFSLLFWQKFLSTSYFPCGRFFQMRQSQNK